MTNDSTDDFTDIIAAKLNEVRQSSVSNVPLRIAVLGPSLDNSEDPGTRKRHQIYDALEEDGHRPFFPENYVNTNTPANTWLEQERVILSDPGVDLVIMIDTPSSVGVLQEIANFVSVPEIRTKSAILCPIEYYRPESSLAANTIQAYFARLPYTNEHLAACQLVSECRRWAHDRQIGNWPGLSPHSF